MKASIKTRVEHTINFNSSAAMASLGFVGLKDHFINIFERINSFEVNGTGDKTVLRINNVMPERLDETDDVFLEFIAENGYIDGANMRVVIQYLVNKGELPSGDYVITFKEEK